MADERMMTTTELQEVKDRFRWMIPNSPEWVQFVDYIVTVLLNQELERSKQASAAADGKSPL